MMLSSSPMASRPIATSPKTTHLASAVLVGSGDIIPTDLQMIQKVSAVLGGSALLFESLQATLSGTSNVIGRAEGFTDYVVTLSADSSLAIGQGQMTMMASAVLAGNGSFKIPPKALLTMPVKATILGQATVGGVLVNKLKAASTITGQGTVIAKATVFGPLSATLKATSNIDANAIRFTAGSPTIAAGLLRPPSVNKTAMRLR